MAKLTASREPLEVGSETTDTSSTESRPARDVQRLLRVAGARDHRYEEVQARQQRRSAAERWPLLKATDIALALRRQGREEER